ncbi:MAG: formamidopyrimidine-DNA glycosylase [Candidatus Buchananbacteria bacterium CG10_big_fil_rev_8_21_14_0_10_42_9]|uniref:Formamidopyrimidine-DNA glycosylase n=1 Tax=Candidatus Buchananbacteria bacterium CG10_big_fil_rev_8_21_14_0_10_42_9 TaxID=1974526 RepID=A0A2H0W1W7_9BACT|nr:MAG: formamidopyrimidine-DNA glycosylase [Candidatus Buchananbacteria bacterium CG10_big_fil_rev_8_21_14_0_10_42_9]
MPELPEVETLVKELHLKLKGKKIKAIEVKKPKMVKLPLAKFKHQIAGKKIVSVTRRAKMIIVDISGPAFLLIHLKMTGQLVFLSKRGKKISGGHPIGDLGVLPNKYSHVILTFTDGAKLFFNDQRQFGWLRIANDKELNSVLKTYGPEPLEPGLTQSYLNSIIKRYKNRKIKQLLLDQSLISGLGNIYVDEACFYAKIKPTRRSGSLTSKERQDLFLSIKKALRLGIKHGGTTMDHYRHSDGSQGNMREYLKVYGRANKTCLRKNCFGTIKKIKLAQRGTHYCNVCQK